MYMKNSLVITVSAEKRLKFLLEKELKSCFFRICINSGGCSGFQYIFSIDSNRKEEDVSVFFNSVEIVIDLLSCSFVRNGVLDYTSNLMSSNFILANSKSSSSCGCGNSFAI